MHVFGIRSYATPPVPAAAFIISTDRTNWNLLDELGYTPTFALDVTITISGGKVVRASNTSHVAMDLAGLFTGSTVTLANNGTIHGRGGDGADANSDDGAAGSDAINGPGSGVAFSITNAAGRIFGGGGGGGAGGNSIRTSGFEPIFAGGGGGGGGAGGSLGGAGGPSDGNPGEDGGNGTTGSSGAPGAGGDGGSVPGSVAGGAGGAGGAYGAAGAAGSSGQHGTINNAGGAGGAAGKAIDLNGGSVTFVNGNEAARVKGAVS